MVVLGYSEIEISMKGSGYQFIHAADMMHCATNHMRSTFVTNSGFGKDTKHHIIILVQTFKLLDTRATNVLKLNRGAASGADRFGVDVN